MGVVDLTFAKKTPLTHDTYLFKFNFPKEDQELCMGTNNSRPIKFHVVLPTPEHPEGTLIKR